ncbi:class I SAM-dependent methyltransferase [Halorussus salinisoli]|uniref:class I SAM-dependent methyltransferase n=1 Tax=Halorussus salinisoli TaxID=2558242 RepID=UPI0014857EB0|nr:class I SAM-dependent methyltransferase [Halorussus salinisoli]
MGESTDAHEKYGEMAARYADSNPDQRARAEYEWPVVRSLLPDVSGKRVLDAGCGSGYYSAWLAERGAEVVGIDASEEMIAEATDRHGDEATFLVADLREPLDAFEDESFDLVVSQLTLEHVEDWRPPMAEFHRVSKPGGRLVVSCDHPFTTYFVIEHEDPEIGSADATEADYYEVERYDRVWGEGEKRIEIPCYRRSLRGVLGPIFGAGFVLEDLREPRPPETDGPLAYFESHTPRFLVVRARKPSPSSRR